MKKKQTAITFIIVTVIFLLGFFIRLEYIQLPGINADDKSFYEDQNGLPYMYEFGDSYYHYRLINNYITHGYPGDELKSGMQWDIHSYFPPGVPMDYPPLIIYLAAFLYRFLNLFADIPVMKVCFWIPVFAGPLAGVVAYFFTLRFTNMIGAAAAGIFTVTSPRYAIRTIPGFFDTDIFIVIFPLLIIWFFLEAIQSKERKMQIIFSSLSALFMFGFSMAWSGWFYLFFIVALSSFIYLVVSAFKKNDFKKSIIFFLIFTAGSVFLTGAFNGFKNIKSVLYQPFILIRSLGENPWAPWPDVYSIVSELEKPSALGIAANIGFVLCIITAAGILFIFAILINTRLKNLLLGRISWFFYIFLLIWLISGVTITLSGTRFVLLLLPSFVIIAGIAAGVFAEYLKLLKEKSKYEIFMKKNISGMVLASFFLFITIPACIGVHQIILNMKPTANDDLWAVSEWIGKNTPENTVVITNWGRGHLFSAIADRPVTFDGRMGYIENLSKRDNNPAFKYGIRSPGIAREYWIDRALVTSDGYLSNAILTMLATTGDQSYLILEDYTGSTAESVEILNNILASDKKTAKSKLCNTYYLTEKQALDVVEYSHPDIKKPFVFVATEEMRDNPSYIFTFGQWDFIKNSGQDFIYTIDSFTSESGAFNSNNGVLVDMRTLDARWKGEEPFYLEIISKNNAEKKYINQNSNFCIFILLDEQKIVTLDKSLANSIFTRLFLEKTGNANFNLIYENPSASVWGQTNNL